MFCFFFCQAAQEAELQSHEPARGARHFDECLFSRMREQKPSMWPLYQTNRSETPTCVNTNTTWEYTLSHPSRTKLVIVLSVGTIRWGSSTCSYFLLRCQVRITSITAAHLSLHLSLYMRSMCPTATDTCLWLYVCGCLCVCVCVHWEGNIFSKVEQWLRVICFFFGQSVCGCVLCMRLTLSSRVSSSLTSFWTTSISALKRPHTHTHTHKQAKS